MIYYLFQAQKTVVILEILFFSTVFFFVKQNNSVTCFYCVIYAVYGLDPIVDERQKDCKML